MPQTVLFSVICPTTRRLSFNFYFVTRLKFKAKNSAGKVSFHKDTTEPGDKALHDNRVNWLMLTHAIYYNVVE